jgi:hypothetical protein
MMSETDKHDDDEVVDSKYQPPKEVSLSEILNKDYDDAALNKYKQQVIILFDLALFSLFSSNTQDRLSYQSYHYI